VAGEEADLADVQWEIEDAGGAILGSLGRLGVYQIGIEAGDGAGLARAIETMGTLDGVIGATYHTPQGELALPAACDTKQDNAALDTTTAPGCAMRDLDYEGMTVAWQLLGNLSLSPVGVAVVDHGLDQASGAFDDTTVVSVWPSGEAPEISRSHGTRVASILAADDGDGGMNGFASQFLGKKLTVVDSHMAGSGGFSLATAMVRALDANVGVINVSIEQHVPPVSAYLLRIMYERILSAGGHALFVAAAGNDGVEVSDRQMPASLDAPNLLVVGGSAACDPMKRWENSNHGAHVDVAAPAVLPVLDYDPIKNRKPHGFAAGAGTSYAAPVVSAVAAILRSIDPSWTPVQIKERLTGSVAPAGSWVTYGRVRLSTPVLYALADTLSSTHSTIAPNGTTMVTGVDVQSTWCTESTFTVEGARTFSFPPNPEAFAGTWTDGGVYVVLVAPDDTATAHVTLSSATPSLHTALAVPDEASFGVGWTEGVGESIAEATSGSVQLTSCEVIERSQDLLQVPLRVHATFEATGQALVAEPGTIARTGKISAKATVNLSVQLASQGTLDAIEAICM